MSTTTQTKPATDQAQAPQTPPTSGRDVAIPGPRLPYPRDLEKRFPAIDRAAWKALVEAIFPNASSPGSVVLALSYCKARKLDPFKRCVHIVPIWSTPAKKMIDSVWPGIAELRTTAQRTGQFAGSDPAVFGPEIEHEFAGEGNAKLKLRFPEWCQVTVYRMLDGVRCAFPGAPVYWLEAYARESRKSKIPNEMWQKRPRGQILKCAEAAALRGAFPEELGSDMSVDEIGAIDRAEMVDVTPPRPEREQFADGAGEPAAGGGTEAEAEAEETGEIIPEDEGEGDSEGAPAGDQGEGAPAAGGESTAPKLRPLDAKVTADQITIWLKHFDNTLAEIGTLEALALFDQSAGPSLGRVSPTQARNARLRISKRRVEIEEAAARAEGGGQ